MAVKASATITLTSYRDTQSVTRYYKLQTAGSSAPSKPTTKPPSSDWTDSEPACDISKELYFCDLTIFSNGEGEYSKVSKSSSYEAAKEAYHKAQGAKDSIDNWCHENNKTLIDGAKIYTGSIDAESINVESLTADAVFIDEMETNLTRFKAVGENEYYETEITGEGIDFKYGTSKETAKTIAGISGDELQIKKTSVLDEMKIGKWTWKINPNNSHLTLIWNGGDDEQ